MERIRLCQWARRARCWCRRRQADQRRAASGLGGGVQTRCQSRRLISGIVSGSRAVARFTGATPPSSRLTDGGEIGKGEHR